MTTAEKKIKGLTPSQIFKANVTSEYLWWNIDGRDGSSSEDISESIEDSCKVNIEMVCGSDEDFYMCVISDGKNFIQFSLK